MNPPDRPLDLASVDWVLSTARSVRRHLDFSRPVAPSVLFECIDVAVQAPTGLGGENWRFVVVTEAARKQVLADLYRDALATIVRENRVELKATQRVLAERLQDVPAMILVCVAGPPPPSSVPAQVAFYGSVLPAAWSLMLALRARGIGSTWTSLLSSRQTEVAAALGIPENVTQTVMLPVAYTKGAQLKPAQRKRAPQVTYFNRWGEEESN